VTSLKEFSRDITSKKSVKEKSDKPKVLGKKGPTEVEPKFVLFELVFYPVQGGMSKRMIMFSETMQCSLLLVLQECGAINAQHTKNPLPPHTTISRITPASLVTEYRL